MSRGRPNWNWNIEHNIDLSVGSIVDQANRLRRKAISARRCRPTPTATRSSGRRSLLSIAERGGRGSGLRDDTDSVGTCLWDEMIFDDGSVSNFGEGGVRFRVNSPTRSTNKEGSI